MAKSIEKLARVTRVGLDLAKSVFQVHGADAKGDAVVVRKLRRGGVLEFFGRLAPCVVAMEACASAHHWGREIAALGHEVKLIPPAHVKPYVRRNKTDAADAAAICEAALRPGQRFVPLRAVDNQAELNAPSGSRATLWPAHGAPQRLARSFERDRRHSAARRAARVSPEVARLGPSRRERRDRGVRSRARRAGAARQTNRSSRRGYRGHRQAARKGREGRRQGQPCIPKPRHSGDISSWT